MSRRTDRVGSLMRRVLSEVLFAKLADPRVDPSKTSFTNVEVAEDFLSAKVFVSVMGSDAEERNTLRALQHASGRLQELMMRKISLRHTPRLRFLTDEKYKQTMETLATIDRAMDEIHSRESEAGDSATQEPLDQNESVDDES